MRHHRLLALSACLLSLPAIAEIPLESIRVSMPVELRSEGKTAALQAHGKVDEGDLIVTGNDGRASLQFAEQSVIMLGGNSELYIHSADPPDIGQGAVMRMQLARGDLQVDARVTENVLPQDFRLNIGTLTVRVLGGHVWATADSKGETICLLEGAAEINNGDDRHRLDGRNDCLGHRIDTGAVRIITNTPEVIQALLSRTAFDAPKDSTSGVLPQHLAMAPANLRSNVSKALPSSAVIASRPLPVPIANTVVSPKVSAMQSTGGSGWTVVVASIADGAVAEQMKNQLAAEGLPSSVRPSATDPSRQRVAIGEFATRSEAQRFATKLKAQARFKGAWVVPLSGQN